MSAALVKELREPTGLGLLECKKCLKDKGRLTLVTDYANYWRFFKKKGKFAEYHATSWKHYFLFQPEHVFNLLKEADYDGVQVEKCVANRLDRLFLDRGNKFIKAVAFKPEKK